MPKLKEYKLTRTSYILEECYVMAKDLEEAREKGYLEEQDWEMNDSQSDIEAEAVDNIVNFYLAKNKLYLQKRETSNE
tara:strand:- start:239 stop:472 length:234 start_codon:yes stop_codon:yes gene_type:complete